LHIEPKNQTKPETEIIAKNSVGERSVFDENGLIESHKKDLKTGQVKYKSHHFNF